MIDSAETLRARLRWVTLYRQTGDAGLTCRRCGISRPTLRKWWRRYRDQGQDGLHSRSRRRHRLPEPKVTSPHEQIILTLRGRRRLGPKRIQGELRRLHEFGLSTATIWKVLRRNSASTLRLPKRPKTFKRYSRPVPGDRVQIDSCKIGRGLIQFTAIDDCTRMRVLGLYPDHTTQSALHFLTERVLEEFPFPVQRIQTDNGSEFFAYAFQDALRERRIKFRPNLPYAPHLNGKVERSQQTDKVEFWPTVDRSLPVEAVEEQLDQWQHYYNWERPHSALGVGKTPMDRLVELIGITPDWEDVAAAFDPSKEGERMRNTNWTWGPARR